MAKPKNITSLNLTVYFDVPKLRVRAGESWQQAEDPEAWWSLDNDNSEATDRAIVVEILKKLTNALQGGGKSIEMLVEGQIILQGVSPLLANAPVISRSVEALGHSSLIDLNRASQEDLETLPGVGPTLAASIIAKRPYRSIDDLRGVWGIGAAKMAEIRPLVRL